MRRNPAQAMLAERRKDVSNEQRPIAKESPGGISRTRSGLDCRRRWRRSGPFPSVTPAGNLLRCWSSGVPMFRGFQEPVISISVSVPRLGLEAQVIAAGNHVSRGSAKRRWSHPSRKNSPLSMKQLDRPEILTPASRWYCPQSRLDRCCWPRERARCRRALQHRSGSFTRTTQCSGSQECTSSVIVRTTAGTHSRIRDALGIKLEGLGELDEHYIFVYFRADWGELIRGYEADAILIDQPGLRGFS